ncbi:hypothetical protein JCM8547_005497 [Rhodosporidiobolus lusitaniae]
MALPQPLEFLQPDASFPSFDAFYLAANLAFIPSYGYTLNRAGNADAMLRSSNIRSARKAPTTFRYNNFGRASSSVRSSTLLSHIPPFLFRLPDFPYPSLPLNTAFLPTLTSFLTALHPSLSSLAPFLLAAGVDSFESLTALISFEPSTLRVFLDEAAKGVGEGRKPSAVQIRLLEKGLRESGV